MRLLYAQQISRAMAAAAIVAFWLSSGAASAGSPSTADIMCGRVVRASEGSKVPARAVYEPDRFQHLQRTLRTLLQSGKLMTVSLGDSIVGDTFGPQYGGLPPYTGPTWGTELIGQYFGSTIQGGVSVLGGTGVWYYRVPPGVQQYVLAYAPDFVIIGGISNRADYAAMRDVVGQIRAAQPWTDIILATGAVDLSAVPSTSSLLLDPAGTTYEAQLKALAEELGAGFIDMRGSYNEFVMESNAENPLVDAAFFQRDPIHANTEGRDVLRELTTAFFRPAIQCSDRGPPRVPAANPPALALTDIKRGLADVAALATADVNGDGRPDLAIFSSAAPGTLLLGPLESGTTVQLGTVALHDPMFADLDGTGALDLAGIDANGSVRIIFGSQSGAPYSNASQSIALPGADQATSFVVLDANQDGRNDILVAVNGGAALRLYLNEGGATPFTAPTTVDLPVPVSNVSEKTQQLKVADVNRDGRPDIVELRVRIPDSSGQLPPDLIQSGGLARLTIRINAASPDLFPLSSTYAVPLGSMQPTAMALADLDGDGNVDLVLGTGAGDGSTEGSVNGAIYAFRNSGRDGTWFFDPVRLTKSASGSCTAVLRIADVDGDGRPDIVSANSCTGSNGTADYYKNTGVIGEFARLQPTAFPTKLANVDLALADLHSSGQADVIAAGTDSGGSGAVVALSSYRAPVPPPSAPSPPPPPPTGQPQSPTPPPTATGPGTSNNVSAPGGGGALQLCELAVMGGMLALRRLRASKRRLSVRRPR